MTYLKAHELLFKARGKASGYKCVSCPKTAKFWAYQHTDPNESIDPEGRPFSYNLEFYEPMCGSCHRQFDIDNDGRVGDIARSNGRIRGAANRERLKSDPEYAARMSASSRETVKLVQAMRRKCSGCDMESTPYGIGSHQKSSGHQGYEEITIKG